MYFQLRYKNSVTLVSVYHKMRAFSWQYMSVQDWEFYVHSVKFNSTKYFTWYSCRPCYYLQDGRDDWSSKRLVVSSAARLAAWSRDILRGRQLTNQNIYFTTFALQMKQISNFKILKLSRLQKKNLIFKKHLLSGVLLLVQ